MKYRMMKWIWRMNLIELQKVTLKNNNANKFNKININYHNLI